MKATLALVTLLATPAVADVGPVPRADIFVLGEVHDNPLHHVEQARIVAEVAPAALVFEMLSPAQAAAAMTVDRTDADAVAQATGWADTGWPDFAIYAPIFAAAPDALVVGAAVPRDALIAVMQGGTADVPDALPQPPFDDATLAMLTQDQADAHCGKLPEEMLPGMVSAQRLRDAAFGGAAAAAFDATGGPVVLITGTGHARTDVGAPAAIRAARPDLTVWALGQLEGEADPDAPFDAVNVTPVQDRPDPCLAFEN